MFRRTFLPVLILATTAGCAGTSPPARIYHPEERRAGLSVPPDLRNADGEARYCASRPASRAQEHKRQALASIAAACGGDDKYFVLGERMHDDVRFSSSIGVETSCSRADGWVIYFKCSGPVQRTPGRTP